MPSPPPALPPPHAHTPRVGDVASQIQPLPMPVPHLGLLPRQYPPMPLFHPGQPGAVGGGQYDGTGQRMGPPPFYYGIPPPPPFNHYGDIALWGHHYPPPQAPIQHPGNVQVHVPVQVREERAHVGAIQAARVDPPVLKSYPNERDKDGAWIIPVEIYKDDTKRKMMSTTNMEWKEFKKCVFARLDSVDIQLLYRISSDGPTWLQLTCEADFIAAMVCAADKALVAWTRVVTINIKNKLEKMKRCKMAAKREKRECKDDLPTGVASKMTDQLAQLRQLEAHLYCATHSYPGKKVFCFVEQGNSSVKGGHQELSNQEMTLVQERGHATIHRRPNVKNLDYPPTKKSKVAPVDSPAMEGNGNPDPSSAKETVKKEELSETSSAPDRQPLGHMIHIRRSHERLMNVLTVCVVTERLPTMKEVLTLMDSEFPSTEEPFVDSCGDLVAFDIHDALDIYQQETLFLATFGTLRRGGAAQIHQYMRNNILLPLDMLESKPDSVDFDEKSTDDRKVFGWREKVEPGLEEERIIEVESEDEVEEVGDRSSSFVEEIEGLEVGYTTQEEV
ncbi:hypothetical protein EI94DRAFT_1821909 [Lactarius quietus]|nr:hypothetical protein EI94DRAFT_1821909 [Lactarius quietus]